jgi:hypothetical protein
MTPEDQKRLATCTAEIAEILHRNSEPSGLDSLEGIEQTVRQQMLEQGARHSLTEEITSSCSLR